MSLKPIVGRKKIKPFEVYDIETTIDLKKVYMVGWYDGLEYKLWESRPLQPEHPESAISQYLAWRLATPTKCPQYAHNGGNFDTVFALASLIANNRDTKIEIIPSQSSILLMKVELGSNKWEFRDSARTLPDSLDNLGKCFVGRGKVEVSSYETLHTDPKRYEYLRQDCMLLYEVLEKYFQLLYDKIGGQAGISAASTALATYRTSYQPKDLPDISAHARDLARRGYYGGRCEPFRREYDGAELHCYDVNSMYPWAMRQPQPIEEIYIDGYHPELTGFVEATVSVGDCHLPILPCRTKGRLLFPTGTWRGVFSTAELRLAAVQGQIRKLKFHDAVYFRTADIFSSYVDTLYAFRDKASPSWELPLDRIAKISLNSLYGKFGSQSIRETIHIRPTVAEVFDRQMQQMPSAVDVDCYIERTEQTTDYMLPQISAWITALGRCRLAEGLIAQGKDAYYCDTDSIYTSGKVDTGTGLGAWKDEYADDPISYAYFLAPKVYVLRHRSGKVTNKAKGFAKFGEKLLPDNAVALLAAGKGLAVSRFAKARSVIRGDFGLMLATKRCHLDYDKRIFHDDGTSSPREVNYE